MVQESSMTDTTRDDPLEWHEIFNDDGIVTDAADYLFGVMLLHRFLGESEGTLQFLPGYRVRPMQGDMDRARLVRR